MSEFKTIQKYLGDKAAYYLEHESKTVPRERLHLPSPDFVSREFGASDRNRPEALAATFTTEQATKVQARRERIREIFTRDAIDPEEVASPVVDAVRAGFEEGEQAAGAVRARAGEVAALVEEARFVRRQAGLEARVGLSLYAWGDDYRAVGALDRWGIMADDQVAGVYAGVALWLTLPIVAG